jgi:ketosteroid isomerase-like protein
VLPFPALTSGVLLSALLVAACGEAPRAGPAAGDVATLRAADSLLQLALTARDADRAAAFYAEDAVLLPVAEPIVEGRTAIRDEWRHLFAIPGYSAAAGLVAAVTSADGTLGYTRGTYASPMLAPDGQEVVERGKWVSVWRRDPEGRWRIVVDIYNTDAPPPDHQPSTAGRPGQ